ncbi:MAG: mandelate racemase/muconate lactonizing protein [bacterium]|nr:mandelate racemase/muconate lactonizing protein [bacterium]MDE0352405.1 mandelate racemase/muconate lactonizing protein [bacterium]
MRITGITATPVEVPRLARFLPRTAHGSVKASRYVVLEIECSPGRTGLGEITCDPRWNGEEALETSRLLRGPLGEALLGADPLQWADVSARIDGVVSNRPFLRAAVEMACLDVAGRHFGIPAHAFLGGAYRTGITTKLVLPARDVETVGAMAADAAGLGATTLKVKVGLGVEEDIARVATVRSAAGPDVQITVDANEGWNPEEAATAFEGLAALGVVAVEQPLPRMSAAASATLLRSTSMAVMGDESIWTAADVVEAARHRSFDTVNLYPGKCGGLRRTIRMAGLARAVGLAVSFGSNLELGVGAAAMAHTAAATKYLSPTVPSDLIGPLYFEATMVENARFVGWRSATVPPGAGLGVRLDRGALDAYRIPDGAV